MADSPDDKTQTPDSEATDPKAAGTEAADTDASSADGQTAAASGDNPGAPIGTEDIEQLLDQASESLEQAAGEQVSVDAEARPYSLGDLSPATDDHERQPIDLLGEVEMDLRIELGRTQMRLEEVLQLRGGSVVALDKLAGDPVAVFVNGRLIARGEVLVMNDNFCIRVTELVGA